MASTNNGGFTTRQIVGWIFLVGSVIGIAASAFVLPKDRHVGTLCLTIGLALLSLGCGAIGGERRQGDGPDA